MKGPFRTSFVTEFFNNKYSKAGLLAFVLIAMLPGQVMAQTAACSAQLNAEALGGPIQYINEPITIELEMGAGLVTEPTGGLGYLDIFSFTYDMDCEFDPDAPATWPNCTPAGNTVEFVGNVWTDCTNDVAGGAPVVLSTQVTGQQVKFSIDPAMPDPDAIRNLSEQTCKVRFDIVVTAIEGENLEREIFELTGFAGTDGDAICSNGLLTGKGSSVLFDLSTVVTNFTVTKTFSDDNPGPVDVHLRCNTGLPLEQDFTITKDTLVTFVVKSFEPGAMDCEVWETPVPGYMGDYAASATTGIAGSISDDADGCYYDDIVNGNFICEITNDADSATFTAYKVWHINSENGDEVNTLVPVTITCTSDITSSNGSISSDDRSATGVLDHGGALWVKVDTLSGPTSCSASESINQSGVESSGCEDSYTIPAGGSSECTFTNTVFFEGIPTLSQYGLALMALLMLGMGMVSFRRFS